MLYCYYKVLYLIINELKLAFVLTTTAAKHYGRLNCDPVGLSTRVWHQVAILKHDRPALYSWHSSATAYLMDIL